MEVLYGGKIFETKSKCKVSENAMEGYVIRLTRNIAEKDNEIR